MADLDFAAHNTLFATHGLHAYAAKCPPQLVNYGLRYYSRPGEKVLDPMTGSGTTLVEAKLMSRHAVGYDIDPLARLIAQVKSSRVQDGWIEQAYERIHRKTLNDIAALRSRRISTALRERATPPDFDNRDYWFDKKVSASLAILAYHITHTQMRESVRNFFWVAFSSLILAKTSVANARDIIHSRHHHWQHDETPDVVEKFAARIRSMRKQMADFCAQSWQTTGIKTDARLGDARRLRVRSETVDLIFTSPPYATALDYPRGHFLAVAWMRDVLGVSLEEYRANAPTYVGSERGRWPNEFTIDDCLEQLDLAPLILTNIAQYSSAHAKRIHRYFVDMYQVFSEIARVLKEGRHAIIVVCPSHIRRVEVPTQRVFAEIGHLHRLRLKYCHARTICLGKRILPYMQEAFGRRMDTEYVLIFQKTP
ncbi:MAG TPA: DNA methyltransferase [Pyrinomonadaceae bacterium]|nr:DNA methyltransferase [Pyrinomonadaceae bacterium]